MRRLLPVALAMALLASASPAAADLVVNRYFGEGGGISVRAQDGPARAIVEHFADDSRNGIRVRQIGFGDPAITEGDPECDGNPAFNDVVCRIIPEQIVLTGSASADEFRFGGSNQGCAAAPATLVVGSLEGGADRLSASVTCVGNTAGINRLHPRFDVDGGIGSDTLTGGRADDRFQGNEGRDTIEGGSGNDTLMGDGDSDTVAGGAGNDLLQDRNFRIFGSADADADVFDGGGGIDTFDYQGSSGGVTITLLGGADDGTPGEGDSLVNIENAIGGVGRDRIIGTDAANRLEGGFENDELIGLDGEDVVLGGQGDDVIDVRDAPHRDVVTCGTGFDHVVADLSDVAKSPSSFTDDTQCERIERFAVDDGPPARIVTRRARIVDNAVSLRLSCARRAKVDCRGRLRLKDGRRTLATARYAAQRGRRSGPVRLPLNGAVARRVRRAGRVVAITRERGASEKGPRSVVDTLRVSRAS